MKKLLLAVIAGFMFISPTMAQDTDETTEPNKPVVEASIDTVQSSAPTSDVFAQYEALEEEQILDQVGGDIFSDFGTDNMILVGIIGLAAIAVLVL